MVKDTIYEADVLRNIGDVKLSASFRVMMINRLHDHYSEINERLVCNAHRTRREANVIARNYQQEHGCNCDDGGLCDCALEMYASRGEIEFCDDLHRTANMLDCAAERYERKLRRLEKLAKAIHTPALRMAA